MSNTRKKVKIRFFYKLLMGFGILCIIIGIVLISGNEIIQYTSDTLHVVVNKQVRSLAKINQLHYRANEIRLLELELSEIDDFYTVSGEIDNLQDLADSFEKDLRNFVFSFMPEENETGRLLLSSWQLYRDDLEQTLQYAKSMDMAEAKEVSRHSSFPRFQMFSKYLEQISAKTEEKAQRDYINSIAEIEKERFIFSSISIMGIIGGIIITFLLSHSLSKRILALRAGALHLAKGNLENPIPIEGNDELTDLAVSFNEMTANLRQTTTSVDNLNREVAERKRIEQKLQSINQELENFAYVVSHDLKAPLRGIKNLADWISADYAGKLDDQGKEQMSLLVGRVDRMQNLIDGILQYSRVGRVEEEKTAVNLNELVAEVIDMIAPPENINITVENQLPVIECSPTRIMQVFQNLLSNAIKYMDKPEGWIKIGCAEEDGFWKFSVADSGRGIEERNFGKIFQLFQTVEPINGSESTGVGLTLVKKIIEMYDGKLWVESKAGEGSTFFFTLSQQKVNSEGGKIEAGAAESKA